MELIENEVKSEDLGIYSDIPFTERIIRFVNVIISILFINPISSIFWDIIWVVLIVIIISSRIRLEFNNNLVSIFLIGILIVVFFVWGLFLSSIWPRIERFLNGDPVFGRLGGMERKYFFTILKCSQVINFKFKDDDLARIKEYNKLDTEFTEEVLKDNYLKNVADSSVSKESFDFESKWSEIWNEKILKIGSEGVTFKDALSEDNIAFRILPLKFKFTIELFSPTVKFFQLVMIYFILIFLNGSIELLTLIQIGVFLSFILNIVWLINHSYNLVDIPLGGFIVEPPESLHEKFSNRINAFIGQKVTPLNVKIKKRYFSLIRDFLAPIIFIGTSINTISIILFIGLTLLFGTICMQANMDNIFIWYKNFVYGILLIPVGFIVGHYLTFFILQNFKKIMAPMIFGLLGAGLPFIIEYLFTGNLELNEAKNVIFATISGLSTLFATTIISQMRNVIEEEE